MTSKSINFLANRVVLFPLLTMKDNFSSQRQPGNFPGSPSILVSAPRLLQHTACSPCLPELSQGGRGRGQRKGASVWQSLLRKIPGDWRRRSLDWKWSSPRIGSKKPTLQRGRRHGNSNPGPTPARSLCCFQTGDGWDGARLGKGSGKPWMLTTSLYALLEKISAHHSRPSSRNSFSRKPSSMPQQTALLLWVVTAQHLPLARS